MTTRKISYAAALGFTAMFGALVAGARVAEARNPVLTCSNTNCYGPSFCQYAAGLQCSLQPGSCTVSYCKPN